MTSGAVLLELAVILLVCAVTSRALARLHQPAVVAQMVAGIAVGPSLLGLWAPWQHLVLSASSVQAVSVIGQLGLVLLMFAAGAELDLTLLRRRAPAATAVAAASILVPLAAGAAVAVALAGDARLLPAGGRQPLEMAFLAVALAVTAFPVMAGIIAESGLASSVVGTTSLAAGSATDAVAWCLLALLLAANGDGARGTIVALAAAAGLAALAMAARRWRVLDRLERADQRWAPALLLGLLLLVAAASDGAGLHPAFGAFVCGLAVPRGGLLDAIRERLQPAVVLVLLPPFFVSAGLATHVSQLLQPGLPLVAAALLATACLSKGVSCWGAAMLTGRTVREAIGIGALMNAKGLVELVVLTVGLQRGLITPTLFSIMVVVAVATTMIAGPVIAHLGLVPAAAGRGPALARSGRAGEV